MRTLGLRQAGEALKGILQETGIGRVAAKPAKNPSLLFGWFKKLGERG
jgi:hypothetical protein